MDARKTVLIVTPGAQTRSGGIAKIVDHTVRGWPAESQFRFKVIDSYGTTGPVRGAAQMPFYFITAMISVLYALLSNNVHVLHLNMTERLSVWRKLSFALIGIVFGVPVIIHMHGADFSEYFERLPRWRQKVVRRIMHSCSMVLVLGTYWKEFVETKLEIPPNKVRIVHNAVPMVAEPRRTQLAKCRLLFLGIVGERKGVDTLLRALAHPLMAVGDWEAVIGGNGEVSRFEALSAELGLADQVKFTGLLDAASVKDQFARADIFVLPSRNEGLPVALIEAMSYGCAIVSTPVGSIADAIISEETGLLVDAGDYEGLAAALFRLLESTELRLRLGAGAKRKFVASFTLPLYLSELNAAYESIAVRPVAHLRSDFERSRLPPVQDEPELCDIARFQPPEPQAKREIKLAQMLEVRSGKTQQLPDNDVSEFMGLPLHNLHRDVIAKQVLAAVHAKRKMVVINANAHMMVLAQKLPWIRTLFTRADIAFCDGAGVQFAHRFLNGSGLHRTTPPEWIGPVLRSLGENASIFWIGGKADVVAVAARRYEEAFGVRTAGVQHGYFDLDAGSEDNRLLLEKINEAKPSIILVNMGMPRQERWIFDNLDQIDSGVIISAGALVDHAAGLVHRPPRWVANLGLEWLVRLAREPKRLWRRYLVGLPIFGLYILSAMLEGRKSARSDTQL